MRQIQSIPILGEDNDDEIVGRILTRREALSVASFAGLTLLIGCGGSGGGSTAAASTSTTSGTTATTGGDAVDLVATPQVTEGPFFVDEKLNRSNLLGDATRASVANGLPLTLSFTIF
ncbi:hypothetical protein EON81_16450 [bacterium]|nr:MAG: hypothetical protein EON81_16450 [bacterium]